MTTKKQAVIKETKAELVETIKNLKAENANLKHEILKSIDNEVQTNVKYKELTDKVAQLVLYISVYKDATKRGIFAMPDVNFMLDILNARVERVAKDKTI